MKITIDTEELEKMFVKGVLNECKELEKHSENEFGKAEPMLSLGLTLMFLNIIRNVIGELKSKEVKEERRS